MELRPPPKKKKRQPEESAKSADGSALGSGCRGLLLPTGPRRQGSAAQPPRVWGRMSRQRAGWSWGLGFFLTGCVDGGLVDGCVCLGINETRDTSSFGCPQHYFNSPAQFTCLANGTLPACQAFCSHAALCGGRHGSIAGRFESAGDVSCPASRQNPATCAPLVEIEGPAGVVLSSMDRQIVTTPGELIGVYSAIFKDPEPVWTPRLREWLQVDIALHARNPFHDCRLCLRPLSAWKVQPVTFIACHGPET